MKWDETLKATDVAIVFATLIGPILAIQAQAFLERRRAVKDRRLNVFYTLMRTRATPVAPEAVNALNAVPLEFYDEEEIIDAYRAFITHIATPRRPNAEGVDQAWGDRLMDFKMDLLSKIAALLDYKFSVAELKREFYAPQAHLDLEADQTAIRQGFAKIMKGEAGLKVEQFTGAHNPAPHPRR